MAPPTITASRTGNQLIKPFTWSYSRLKNFEVCPKKHWHVDIQKDFKEEEGEQLTFGNKAHDALAKRISKGTPIPAGFGESFIEVCEGWVSRIITQQGNPGVDIYVEQKLAITRDFMRTGYFDKDVWFRGVGDVIKLMDVGNDQCVALIADWKTGKIVEDSVQLALMAQCVFAHYPKVIRVRSEFIWLKDDANTSQTLSREDMPELWNGLWPRLEQLEHAHKTSTYPAKPGRLCRKWCPVTACAHHGGGG